MSDLKKYKACLITFGEALKQIVKEEKIKKNTNKNEFNSGYLCSLHRTVRLLQQQAEIYNIPLHEICLEDLSEEDLIQ
jgi:hypothetical protein